MQFGCTLLCLKRPRSAISQPPRSLHICNKRNFPIYPFLTDFSQSCQAVLSRHRCAFNLSPPDRIVPSIWLTAAHHIPGILGTFVTIGERQIAIAYSSFRLVSGLSSPRSFRSLLVHDHDENHLVGRSARSSCCQFCSSACFLHGTQKCVWTFVSLVLGRPS